MGEESVLGEEGGMCKEKRGEGWGGTRIID